MVQNPIDESLIKRYEEMINQSRRYYFDTDEIELIAFHFERTENYSEALNVINFGLSLHCHNEYLSILKVRYLISLDFLQEARSLIKTIKDIDSIEYTLIEIELLFAETKEDEAKEIIYSYISLNEIDADFCVNVINIMYGYGDSKIILDFINKIIDKVSDMNDILIDVIAVAFIENGESQRAINLVNGFIDENPYNKVLWRILARAYQSIDNIEESIECCDYALAIEEDDIDTLQFKFAILCDSNRYKEAEELIFKIEHLSQEEEEKIEIDELADGFFSISENPRGAIKYLEFILPNRKEKSIVLLNIANAYFDMGNSPMADEYINKAIEINPDDFRIRLKAGLMYIDADFIDKSVEHLDYVYNNKKDSDEETRLVIVKAYMLSSLFWQKGINLMIEHLMYNPDDLESVFLLIRTYCKYGLYDEAIECIDNLSKDKNNKNGDTKYNVIVSAIIGMFKQYKEQKCITTNGCRDRKSVV